MSYDLMVFDPSAAPDNAAEFEEWFQGKMHEIDDLQIKDPEATTPALKAWYLEMVVDFPNYNASENTDGLEDAATGYSSCPTVIYADFRWSKANEAYRRTAELAFKHRLGFFNVSGPKGEVWGPRGSEYVLLFEATP